MQNDAFAPDATRLPSLTNERLPVLVVPGGVLPPPMLQGWVLPWNTAPLFIPGPGGGGAIVGLLETQCYYSKHSSNACQ